MRPFEGSLVFSGQSSAGLDEIWEDREGVRRHYRGGVLETVEWRHRNFGADSEQAKRWFAPGIRPEDRKPFVLSRADSPYGADPETGVLQASEIWAHPELGDCTVFVSIDTRTGDEKRSDPRWLRELKAAEALAERRAATADIDAEAYLLDLEGRGRAVREKHEREVVSGRIVNPDLERLRNKVSADREAAGQEQDKDGGKKKLPESGAPDLNKLRAQVKSLHEDEGKTEPQWRLPDPGL